MHIRRSTAFAGLIAVAAPIGLFLWYGGLSLSLVGLIAIAGVLYGLPFWSGRWRTFAGMWTGLLGIRLLAEPALWTISGQPVYDPLAAPLREEDVAFTLVLLIIARAAYLMGVRWRIIGRSAAAPESPSSRMRLVTAGVVFVMIGWGAAVLGLSRAGGVAIFLAQFGYRREMLTEIGTGVTMAALIGAAGAWLVAASIPRLTSRTLGLMAIVGVTPTLLVAGRWQPITALVGLLIIAAFRGSRISRTALGIVGIFAIFLIVLIPLARSASWALGGSGTLSAQALLREWADSGAENILASQVGFEASSEIPLLVRQHGYLKGASWVPLGRALVGRRDNEALTVGGQIRDEFFPYRPARPPGYPLTMYLNFGVLGVLFGGVALGAVHGHLERLARTQHNSLSPFMAAVGIVALPGFDPEALLVALPYLLALLVTFPLRRAVPAAESLCHASHRRRM